MAGLLSGAIRLNHAPVYLREITVSDLSGLATHTISPASATPALRFYVKVYQNMHPVYVSTV